MVAQTVKSLFSCGVCLSCPYFRSQLEVKLGRLQKFQCDLVRRVRELRDTSIHTHIHTYICKQKPVQGLSP